MSETRLLVSKSNTVTAFAPCDPLTTKAYRPSGVTATARAGKPTSIVSTTARDCGSIRVMLFPLAFAVKTAGIVVAFADVAALAPVAGVPVPTAVVPLVAAPLVAAEGVVAPVAPVVAAAEGEAPAAALAAAEGEAPAAVVAPAEGEADAADVPAAGVVPAAGEAVLLAGAPQATARTSARPIAPESLSLLRDLAFSSIGLGSSCLSLRLARTDFRAG